MKRVLIIQLRQLGDILLTTPCPREIKRQFPEAHVAFWSHRMGKMVLADNPSIDELHLVDEKNTLKEQWEFFRELRAQTFDLVLDFMNNPRSAIGTLLSGGERRAGFSGGRSWAYNLKATRASSPTYIVREKFSLMRAAGLTPRDESLVLPWGQGDVGPARIMADAGDASWKRFAEAPIRVVMAPTHRREARRWPLARYAEIADRLVREWNAGVVWLWGPGEEAEVDQAMGQCREKTFKALPTKFREMAALVGNCDLFVGNSNGPSHVAVATGITSLQLHGPTPATSWCPMNDRHRAVQSTVADPGQSMNAISLDDVWRELAKMKDCAEAQAAKRKSIGFRGAWV